MQYEHLELRVRGASKEIFPKAGKSGDGTLEWSSFTCILFCQGKSTRQQNHCTTCRDGGWPMANFDIRVIQEFADESLRASKLDDIVKKFRHESSQFGFDYFVALSLCDLANPPEDVVWIDQAPKGWDEVYIKNDFQSVDPYFEAAVKQRLPFVWSKRLDIVDRTKGVTQAAHDMLDEAATYGYGDGISIPMVIPGTHRGCVSLTGERPDLSEWPRHTIHLMGIYFFESCLRINKAALRDWKAKEFIGLTEQEKHTLRLLGNGHNASNISEILKVSEPTVRYYIQRAKKKLGANNVTHAVAKAILYGHIEL